ncbi:cobalamin-binding protein [Aestuariibacter salexigens]|uniref:cobalamin-binding protein n=1 Tax=Aestuariibacter salexigens TaxID=226010 RepID=UPI0004169002|nr:cobalamin-binding protein [Aestuariibacter salexigens]
MTMRNVFISLLCCLLACCSSIASAQRIVSLAPHTTEWLFQLGLGEQVVGVSAYSDYPAEAAQLPIVADANGVNFEQLIRLQPDIVVAWQGGNKPQDLARITQLGFTVFSSNPQKPEDIGLELIELGQILGTESQAITIAQTLNDNLSSVTKRYAQLPPSRIFYYLWSTPLMSIGPDAWASHILHFCNAAQIFSDAEVDYPQVSVEQVVRRQPDVIIAASHQPAAQHQQFWSRWQDLLDVPLITVNPDLLHRFTPRIVEGIEQLCDSIHQAQSYTADI